MFRYCFAMFTLAVSIGAFGARAHNGEQHDATKPKRPADAPKGIEHHDHTPLHGGEVRMTGDEHVELRVSDDGEYAVWFTDAWRRPLKDFVVGTVTVRGADGEETLPLSARRADGSYAPRGRILTPRRKIVVTAKAGAIPLVAHYELGATVAAAGRAAVAVEITEAGFVPARIEVEAGKPVTLAITRKTDGTCAKDVVVPGYVDKTELPLGKTVEVTFTPKERGSLKYGCSMGQMVAGVIVVP